jgi:hypothetical protein
VVLVVVGTKQDCGRIFSYVYSSESGAWSEPTSSPHSGSLIGWPRCALLVGNALYFVPQRCKRIMEYDLGTREIATIVYLSNKEVDGIQVPIELIATKDGRLGFASVEEDSKLFLWSREADGGRWALYKVIDLEKLLSVHVQRRPYLLGSTEGTGVIFLILEADRLVAVDLWSGLVTEVYNPIPRTHIGVVVPYKSFFTLGISIN